MWLEGAGLLLTVSCVKLGERVHVLDMRALLLGKGHGEGPC